MIALTPSGDSSTQCHYRLEEQLNSGTTRPDGQWLPPRLRVWGHHQSWTITLAVDSCVSHGLSSLCPPSGYETDRDRRQCLPCRINFFKPSRGFGRCQHCQQNAVQPAVGSIACICAPHYYANPAGNLSLPWHSNLPQPCLPCRIGTTCPLPGTTLPTMRIQPGYWRPGLTSENVTRCDDSHIGCRGCAVRRRHPLLDHMICE